MNVVLIVLNACMFVNRVIFQYPLPFEYMFLLATSELSLSLSFSVFTNNLIHPFIKCGRARRMHSVSEMGEETQKYSYIKMKRNTRE